MKTLEVAETVAERIGTELHLDTGSYHCQQSAEKPLKAWLTSQKQESRKTHDLVELLNQCAVTRVSGYKFHKVNWL